MGSRVSSVFNFTLQGVIPPLKSFTVSCPARCRHEVITQDSACLFPAVLLGCCCPACTDKAPVGFIREWCPHSGRWGGDGSVLQLRSAPLSKGSLGLQLV